MKLLFDQNLSYRLPQKLADIYPGSTHVREIAMCQASDREVWDYAKQHGFAIVSKDDDFQQFSIVYGSPPKVVWLRVGNCSVKAIENLLRRHSITLHTFELSQGKTLLVLP